jgi:hypothetical protein
MADCFADTSSSSHAMWIACASSSGIPIEFAEAALDRKRHPTVGVEDEEATISAGSMLLNMRLMEIGTVSGRAPRR